MSSRAVRYTAGEIGRVKVIDDFLPSPEAPVAREDNVKVTLGLSRRSVEYFKRAAKARRVPYRFAHAPLAPDAAVSARRRDRPRGRGERGSGKRLESRRGP